MSTKSDETARALQFIRKITGDKRYVLVTDDNLKQEILATYEHHPLILETHGTHWWEEHRMINGVLYSVGGIIGGSASEVSTIVKY